MEQHSPPLMQTPRSVDIEITSRCNLRCSYCYYFNNPETDYRDLPTDEWLQFFKELGQAAVMDICLVGGEPFTRKDLPLLIQGIVENHMRFSILSNGTLIDDSIASIIRQSNRCNYVQVSIDGSCGHSHDSCRGKGSFDKAVNGIKILQKHDIPVTVRVTLHRHNIEDLDNIARFLLEELQLPSFTTNAAGYLGTCRSNPEIMLSTEDREKAMNTLLRLTAKYPKQISAQAGPQAEAELWASMEHSKNLGKPSLNNGGRLTGCGCPWSMISIRSDGSIIPCTMLSHLLLGQINKDSLEEVWRENTMINSLRQRQTMPLSSFEFCRSCEYIPYCTGNCPGLAYSITGKIDHPSPDSCLKRFLDDGGCLPKRITAPTNE